MQLICMLRKMKTITFAKELDKVSKDCDTLQFGNI